MGVGYCLLVDYVYSRILKFLLVEMYVDVVYVKLYSAVTEFSNSC